MPGCRQTCCLCEPGLCDTLVGDLLVSILSHKAVRRHKPQAMLHATVPPSCTSAAGRQIDKAATT